ncbi:MAG TPA: carboxylesterase/lipase family protein [Polyangiales bacterium]
MKTITPYVALLCALASACDDNSGSDVESPDGAAVQTPDGGADEDGGDAGGGGTIVNGKPHVVIGDGELEGITESNDTYAFMGVPYAKPPVGDLRWKLPVKSEAWTGVRDASKYGQRCAQLESTVLQNAASDTEDCLYLNVWTPELSPSKPLPVLFWIHGGGNVNGSASEPVPYTGGMGQFYNGKALAERDVVVVTFNYRLGAFGFFAHPSVAGESGGAAGNQGLYDQAAALEWVKANIGKFGGDPGKVTIFGESAGSLDVCFHMTSPKSRGLFHGAISQSGGCTTKHKTLEQGRSEQGARLATALGCEAADVACLRGKKTSEILAVTTGGTGPVYSPVVEGAGGFLPDQPRAQFDSGNVAKVPYILGSNTDEGTLFTVVANIPDEAALIAALQRDLMTTDASLILAAYPADKFTGPTAQKDRYARILGDARLVCSTYDSSIRAAAESSGIPAVWTYNFDVPVVIPSMPALKLGSTHGAELTYVFGSSPGFVAGSPSFNADGKAISDRLITYWTNFAKTGNPNGGGELEWPKFTSGANQRINFAAQTTVVSDFRKSECELWMAGYARQFQ